MTNKEACPLQAEGLPEGIYFGLPFEQYINDPAIGRSEIVALNTSPLEYWLTSWMNPKRKPFRETSAMKAGTAMHTLLLEPDAFFDRYFVMPGGEWQDGKVMIKQTDYETLLAQRAIIQSIPEINQLFQYGYPEVSMFWRDPHTGLMVKCRHDYLKEFGSVDYKTTERILTPWTFGTMVSNHGYHVQNALYIEGTHTCRRRLRDKTIKYYGKPNLQWLRDFVKFDHEVKEELFVFVLQKRLEPYPVAVFDLDIEILGAGFSMLRAGLDTYLNHLEQYGTKMWMSTKKANWSSLTYRDVPGRLFK